MRTLGLGLVAALALSGCDAADGPVEDAKAPAAPPTGPLVAAGPAQAIRPDAEPSLQWAANVVKLEELQHQGGATVKLFGTAGGDPAMNGLVTHVAFFVSPAEGWRVFTVGDFLDWRLLSSAPGRVELEIDESAMDPATSEISARSRRLILGWSPGPDGAAPETVTITPAQ